MKYGFLFFEFTKQHSKDKIYNSDAILISASKTGLVNLGRLFIQFHLYRHDMFAEPSIRPVIRKPGTGTLQIITSTDDNITQVSTAFHFSPNTIFVILQEQHSVFIKQFNRILQPWIKAF